MIQDLPNDIKSNICSYLIGSPTYIKLNNNKALRLIQYKYKIFKCKKENCDGDNKKNITYIFRGYNLNFDILKKYKDEVMNYINNYDYATFYLNGEYSHNQQKEMYSHRIYPIINKYKNHNLVGDGLTYDESIFTLKYIFDKETENPFDEDNSLSIEREKRIYRVNYIYIDLLLENNKLKICCKRMKNIFKNKII